MVTYRGLGSTMAPNTSKFCITLTDDLIKTIKMKAHETFGNRKGHLSMYVEMLLRNEFNLVQPYVEEE